MRDTHSSNQAGDVALDREKPPALMVLTTYLGSRALVSNVTAWSDELQFAADSAMSHEKN